MTLAEIVHRFDCTEQQAEKILYISEAAEQEGPQCLSST